MVLDRLGKSPNHFSSLSSLSSLPILSPSPSAEFSSRLFAAVRPPQNIAPVLNGRPSTQPSSWTGESYSSAVVRELARPKGPTAVVVLLSELPPPATIAGAAWFI
ncbi:hypothetical protein ACLB2K_027244 [Fragaria x ananassa]